MGNEHFPEITPTVFVVANGGCDYEHPEVLAICSTREKAEELMKTITDHIFPWNGRAVAEVPMNTLDPFGRGKARDE